MFCDNKMFFDARDNHVSPSVIRKRIKKKMNSSEYRQAVKELQLQLSGKRFFLPIVFVCFMLLILVKLFIGQNLHIYFLQICTHFFNLSSSLNH